MTIRRVNVQQHRPALTLLEVLIAMAIFLFSIAAISQMVIAAGQRALDIRYQNEAVAIAQGKLGEVASGALPLSGQGDTPLDEDPDWHWSVDGEQNSIANLWKVTVHVTRAGPSGGTVDYCTLSQMVFDPSQRGSSFDTITLNGASGSSGSTGTGSQPGSGSSPTGGANSTGASPAAASNPFSPGGSTTPAGGTSRPSTGTSGGSPAGGNPFTPSGGSSNPLGGSPTPGGSPVPGGR